MASSSQKVVLITGTATGIGFTTAVKFAGTPGKKYKVYATMRNMNEKKGDLEKAAGKLLNDTLFIRELDVSDEASRVKCVQAILEEDKRIDILINNAVVSHMGVFEELKLEEDGLKNFQINYFGPFRLMQLVVPGMKKRRSGRILNLSSIGSLLPCPFTDLYIHPKLALEGASESAAAYLRPFNVWVSVVHLGAVKTPRAEQLVAAYGQYQEAFLKPDFIKDEEVQKLYAKQITTMMDLFTHDTCQTTEEVAQFLLNTAEVKKPVLYYQSSEFARKVAEQKYVDPTGEKAIKLYEAGVLSLVK
ncbi:retinol dehydrogenase 8-like [Apostichopus japonicus]|uniref:retinol dehydrogenase 8-like n=1 Tax=Stichopus japonicus TaxID=307972 RepID=UPI003AB8E2FB